MSRRVQRCFFDARQRCRNRFGILWILFPHRSTKGRHGACAANAPKWQAAFLGSQSEHLKAQLTAAALQRFPFAPANSLHRCWTSSQLNRAVATHLAMHPRKLSENVAAGTRAARRACASLIRSPDSSDLFLILHSTRSRTHSLTRSLNASPTSSCMLGQMSLIVTCSKSRVFYTSYSFCSATVSLEAIKPRLTCGV